MKHLTWWWMQTLPPAPHCSGKHQPTPGQGKKEGLKQHMKLWRVWKSQVGQNSQVLSVWFGCHCLPSLFPYFPTPSWYKWSQSHNMEEALVPVSQLGRLFYKSVCYAETTLGIYKEEKEGWNCLQLLPETVWPMCSTMSGLFSDCPEKKENVERERRKRGWWT